MLPLTVRNLLRTSLLCLSLLLSACGAAAPPSGGAARSANLVAPQQAAPAADTSGSNVAGTTADAAEATSRLVIRNATLTLIVQDTLAQMEVVGKMATELGGYIAASNTQKFENGVQARLTIRIPAEKLDTALERLHKLATEVREENITGEDVTAEYTDLNSRLTNLQAAETQLRDILSKATKTDDVLSIFKQLTDIRGQIEQTKGRMQFLSQSAALATVNVTLIADSLAQPLQIAGWHPEGVAKSAVEALINALQVIVNIVIWLVIFALPIGIIIASPFALLYYLLRRRSRRKQAMSNPASSTNPTQNDQANG